MKRRIRQMGLRESIFVPSVVCRWCLFRVCSACVCVCVCVCVRVLYAWMGAHAVTYVHIYSCKHLSHVSGSMRAPSHTTHTTHTTHNTCSYARQTSHGQVEDVHELSASDVVSTLHPSRRRGRVDNERIVGVSVWSGIRRGGGGGGRFIQS